MKVVQFFRDRITPSKRRSIISLGYDGNRLQPRVLLSYLTDAFDLEHKDFNYVSNRKECQLIVSLLIRMGFCVDVVDCRERYYPSNIQYDLILGFGENFRFSNVKEFGKKILYLTEAPPQISFEEELKRCISFLERHGKKVKVERSFSYYTDDDIAISDEIICLGEQHKESLSTLYNKKSYDSFPIGIPVKYKKTEFNQSKQLIWFGSRGFIHKGLDVCIDVFANLPDWTLHICGADIDEVKKLMSIPSNVIFHGRISVDSQVFYKLMQICNFSILLSCSEAVPTSVLTTMRAGLIPILSDKCGTLFSESIIINSIDIELIANVLKNTLNYSENDIQQRSDEIVQIVNEKYSSQNYVSRMKNIFQQIIGG